MPRRKSWSMVIDCINFIRTYWVYKYRRTSRQPSFFGYELSINKITTHGNYKYYNIRWWEMFIENFAEQYYSTATSTRKRIYIMQFYIISSSFVCRIVYIFLWQIERATDGETPAFSSNASLNFSLNFKRTVVDTVFVFGLSIACV